MRYCHFQTDEYKVRTGPDRRTKYTESIYGYSILVSDHVLCINFGLPDHGIQTINGPYTDYTTWKV